MHTVQDDRLLNTERDVIYLKKPRISLHCTVRRVNERNRWFSRTFGCGKRVRHLHGQFGVGLEDFGLVRLVLADQTRSDVAVVDLLELVAQLHVAQVAQHVLHAGHRVIHHLQTEKKRSHLSSVPVISAQSPVFPGTLPDCVPEFRHRRTFSWRRSFIVFSRLEARFTLRNCTSGLMVMP